MCGICGKVDPRGVSAADIARMSSVLAHRGPDDQGTYVEGKVGLGHRRLSIIDLAGGHQPMSSADGSLHITFNGEIYNYRELRERLDASYRFTTNSDTEVILALYQERGEACVDALRGMFAFAIWDAREGSLFLARDHLGQKPLFYTHQGDRFAFASEIKALLADDPSLREMDAEALHQYLTLRIIAPPRSMYSRVRKVPPGHALRFRDGTVTVRRYWDLRYEPKLRMTEEEIVDELERQALEAVRHHMVSDVPVGAFLSGGLDSSVIVGMMSKLAQSPVKTFSVGVPYGKHSELPYARLVAQKYETEHYEEDMPPSVAAILPELVWHLDEPSDPLSACMYHISQMASRHVKVVLGGDGGDELFGGYDRYFGSQYVARYARIPEAVRRRLIGPAIHLVPDGFWYKSLSQRLKWLNDLSFVPADHRYARSLAHFYFTGAMRDSLYGPVLKGVVGRFDPEEAVCAYFAADNAQDAVDRMLYADSMVRLPDHSVMILDRMTMAHGLEARAPFMDHKLAEFAASIPAHLKVRGRTLRYIQTRLAQRYVPAEVLGREKQGFSSSLPYLLSREFGRIFQAFMRDSHLVRDGYLNHAPLAQLLREHQERKADHGNRLWLVCNAEVWYRMAIEGAPKERLHEALGAGNAVVA
jgi:asparagine synthase (glutamine-hydrolysing)